MGKKLFEKLPKAVLEEGITVDVVNAIKMHPHYSPVQLLPGEEPCQLLEMSQGYWIMVDGKQLLGVDNKPIVVSRKEATIGRARYLKNYGAIEKQQKVEALIAQWRKEAADKVEAYCKKVDGLKMELNPPTEGIEGALIMAAQAQWSGSYLNSYLLNIKGTLEKVEPIVEQLKQQLAEGRVVEILSAFGSNKFGNPMISATVGKNGEFNPIDLRVIASAFSAKALQEWDGDVLSRYAIMEVEKQYPI